MDTTWDVWRERLALGLKRPSLAFRKVRGQRVDEISLEEIARHVPPRPTIIDAGAMDGSDSVALARHWPGGHVYAFEPVEENFSALVANTVGLDNVTCVPLALGAQNGTASLHRSQEGAGVLSGSSSLLPPTGHLDEFPNVRFDKDASTVEVVTMDSWLTAAELDGIDLAWLDLQGMEVPVLMASPRSLMSLTAIHMEVHRRELYEGAYLYGDVMKFMEDSGFTLIIDRVGRVAGNALFVRRAG